MSSKNSLLLVDSDTRSLRVLEVSLRKAGFSVTTAETAASALQMALSEPPDLVISDTMLPDYDGFELALRLKSDPRTLGSGIIFLAEDATAQAKIRGINAGAEDFLAKPVLVKEIVARVRALIESRQTKSIAVGERPGNLSGNLANMGVVDLLQVMESGKKSGIVHIASDPIKSGGFVADGDEIGTIYFREGQVVDARMGKLSGLNAVYRMLLWDDGIFEIAFKSLSREDSVKTSTQAILLEGMRRVDEWSRFAESLPPLNARLTIDFAALGRKFADVPESMRPVLHLFDGQRTIFEVVDDAPVDDSVALSVIAELHKHSLLRPLETNTPQNESSKVEAWLSKPPEPNEEEVTDTNAEPLPQDNLPSALGRAVIPSPHTPSEILGTREPNGSTDAPYPLTQPVERTQLPEPIAEETDTNVESSVVLSRHTVPANEPVPLTEPRAPSLPPVEEPIPLPQTSAKPRLAIQRVASVIEPFPGPSAEPEEEPDDDGWEDVHASSAEEKLEPKKPAVGVESGAMTAAYSAVARPRRRETQEPARSDSQLEASPKSILQNPEPPPPPPQSDPPVPQMLAPPTVAPVAPPPAEPAPLMPAPVPAAPIPAPSTNPAPVPAAPAPEPGLVVHPAPEPGLVVKQPEPQPEPAYQIAPAAPPPWPGGTGARATKEVPASESPTLHDAQLPPQVEQVAKRPTREPTPASGLTDSFFDSRSDVFQPSETGIQWPQSNPWKGYLLVGSLVAAVALVLIFNISGNGHRETANPPDRLPTKEKTKRVAAWPKTDGTKIKIENAAKTRPDAAVPEATKAPDVAPTPTKVTPPDPTVPAKPPEPAKTKPPEPTKVVKATPPPEKAKPPVKPPAPAKDPAKANALAKKGDQALHAGQLNTARRNYASALKANPDNARAHSGLAMVFVDIGKDGAARREAWKALKLSKREARAHLALALVAFNKGDTDGAKRSYRKYLLLAPNGRHAGEVRKILQSLP